MTGELRVFLVEDHPLVVEGITTVLRRADGIEVVGVAHTFAEALAAMAATLPDVVLVDQRLPDGSGVDLVASLAAEAPDAHCVMLTATDDADTVSQALEVGARGYLLKDVSAGALIESVRAVARGEVPIDPRVTGMIMEQLRTGSPGFFRPSPRERQLLSFFADGLSNAEIARQLCVSRSTVKGYVGVLLQRLGVSSRAAAVGAAARCGWLVEAVPYPSPRRANSVDDYRDGGVQLRPANAEGNPDRPRVSPLSA